MPADKIYTRTLLSKLTFSGYRLGMPWAVTPTTDAYMGIICPQNQENNINHEQLRKPKANNAIKRKLSTSEVKHSQVLYKYKLKHNPQRIYFEVREVQ